MFLLLLGASLCYKCDHVISVNGNSPMEYNFDVEEGEYICVNSTSPYLAVVFQQRALLAIRYFHSDNEKLELSGKFEFPADGTGVSFANEIGHVEAYAHISGPVVVSTFAFPSLCAGNRYITTMSEEEWILKDKFVTQDEDVCIWNPRPSCSIFDVPPSNEVKSALKICDSYTCMAAVDKDAQEPSAIKLMSRNYLRVDLRNPGFVEDFLVKLASHARKTAEWFKISAILDSEESEVINIYTPGLSSNRKYKPMRFGMKHDDGFQKHHHDDEGFQKHHHDDDFQNHHHDDEHVHGHKTDSNILGTMLIVEIISGMSLIVACIVMMIQCFTNKTRKVNDAAEDRLLSGYPGEDARSPIPSPHQLSSSVYPGFGSGLVNQVAQSQELVDPV